MTKAQKKLWSERAVGAAIAFLAVAVIFRIVRPFSLFATAAYGVGEVPSGSLIAGDLTLSLLGGLLAFLAAIGRQVIAWFSGAKAKRAARRASAAVDAGNPLDDPAIAGSVLAMVGHLRAGRYRPAASAFKSIAGMVWPADVPSPFADAPTETAAGRKATR